MKKLVKSLSVFVVLFVLAFVVVANVKAAPVLKVEGAQIRTSGNEGIRFVAELDTLEGVTERGFLVAKGEYSVEEMKEVGTKYTVSGKTYNMFSAVIYGIPEESYTQDLTVVAYYVTDGDPVYADAAVTRNIAEVAVEAKNNGNETSLVESISSNIYENYKKVFTDKIGNYYVDSAVYESNYEKIAEQFVNDWETKFPGSDITNYTSSLKSNLADNDTVFDKECKLYQFFNDEVYGVKWSWILIYIKEVTVADGALTEQINAILGTDTVIADNTWYYGNSVISRLGGFFTQAYYSAGTAGINFSLYPEYYAKILDYNKTIYADLTDVELVKINQKIELPGEPAQELGYKFDGYYLTDTPYSANSSFDVLNENYCFIPQSSLINYTIEFYDNNEKIDITPITYTIKSSEIKLPDFSKEGFIFKGWFDNKSFDGDAITVIETGSYGDKKLYAMLEEGISVNITFDYMDAWTKEEIFNQFKADVAEYGKSGHAPDFLTYSDGNSYAKDYVPLKAALDNSSEFYTKWAWLFNCIADAHSNVSSGKYVDDIRNLSQGKYTNGGIYTFCQEMKGFIGSKKANDYEAPMYDWGTDLNDQYAVIYAKSKTPNYTPSLGVGTTLPTPESARPGYIFAGWYKSVDYSGDAVTIVPDEEITLYAKWQVVVSE